MVSSNRKSIVKTERLSKAAINLFSHNQFKDLKIPLIVSATDLISGKPMLYKSGSVVDAVVKSSSIPGFVEPTYIDDRMLLDGGIVFDELTNGLGEKHHHADGNDNCNNHYCNFISHPHGGDD